ncbi:hypothetical protein [Paractinoplanes brasiliensis]|uniref:Uncharacterized protein n=1 Tax=Paractinoplanes brasiliensis TaxID=52695 RepID=A0A4R6J8P8_9ACTN|nr:hypothetical protein [Actinoplanes brasiliensis]TDO31974.1 hypothetical protein C8E87_7413 [Actinoplanes brasiliensis]GID28018.1 hypothetical protein Abr02nite_30010 [Actinoplanes brasiliensis]
MTLPLNRKNEGGVVTSETFNLTRITTVLTAVVAAFGATEVGGPEGLNWAGLDSTQRVALVAAAIAAITVITCADILGRSIACGKAENARVHCLSKAHPAKIMVNDRRVEGQVLAMRSSPTPQVLFWDPHEQPGEQPGVSWKDLNAVQFYERRNGL